MKRKWKHDFHPNYGQIRTDVPEDKWKKGDFARRLLEKNNLKIMIKNSDCYLKIFLIWHHILTIYRFLLINVIIKIIFQWDKRSVNKHSYGTFKWKRGIVFWLMTKWSLGLVWHLKRMFGTTRGQRPIL